MAVRDIIRMGHPTLRTPARPLTDAEITSPDTRRLVDDMIDTLHHAGGIGLAAPQIDVPVRLAIIEIDPEASRYGDIPPMPLTVFVNPRIEVVDEASAGFWEGCLSVPGFYENVERPERVRVRALDRDGNPFDEVYEGLLAVCIQHECDHLNGKLFVDYLSNLKRDRIRKKLEKIHRSQAQA